MLKKISFILLSFFLISFISAGFLFNSDIKPKITNEEGCYETSISLANRLVECKEGYYVKGIRSSALIILTDIKCCPLEENN